MDSENIIRQAEEIEALSSIYGKDCSIESRTSFNIRIEEYKKEAILYVTMLPGYPTLAPPKYELSAPWMDRKAKEKLHLSLDEVYLENIGETVVFQWVEKIRETIVNIKTLESKKINVKSVKQKKFKEQKVIHCPEITHGQVIVDRKSSFQGHAAQVHSMEDVNAVLTKLKENKKIMNATHNMYAYRFEKTNGKTVTVQDCDDDGEAHAGGRMLHLLQILDQKNTLVVVSRWYGGIQLGPDRFRHINNATRQVIVQAGFLKK
ncbi:protein IMPACT-B [Aphomia sociella]